jgi:hypothetical protein
MNCRPPFSAPLRLKFSVKLLGTKKPSMKYFFLSQGWQIRRVWEPSGLWNERAWRRKPQISKMGIFLVDRIEKMALYKAEDAVQMVEVVPEEGADSKNEAAIAQVRIKRLISAEQALERITPLPIN